MSAFRSECERERSGCLNCNCCICAYTTFDSLYRVGTQSFKQTLRWIHHFYILTVHASNLRKDSDTACTPEEQNRHTVEELQIACHAKLGLEQTLADQEEKLADQEEVCRFDFCGKSKALVCH